MALLKFNGAASRRKEKLLSDAQSRAQHFQLRGGGKSIHLQFVSILPGNPKQVTDVCKRPTGRAARKAQLVRREFVA
ncbi:hypothetical protein D3C81_611090 [compost metagenome]